MVECMMQNQGKGLYTMNSVKEFIMQADQENEGCKIEGYKYSSVLKILMPAFVAFILVALGEVFMSSFLLPSSPEKNETIKK